MYVYTHTVCAGESKCYGLCCTLTVLLAGVRRGVSDFSPSQLSRVSDLESSSRGVEELSLSRQTSARCWFVHDGVIYVLSAEIHFFDFALETLLIVVKKAKETPSPVPGDTRTVSYMYIWSLSALPSAAAPLVNIG